MRNFNKLLVYNKTPEWVDQYVAKMSQEAGVEIVKMTDAEKVVRGSDVVITTTPAKTPIIRADWLHPGLHHALEAGVISKDDAIVDLGEITAGHSPGCQNDEQITIADLSGAGVQAGLGHCPAGLS